MPPPYVYPPSSKNSQPSAFTRWVGGSSGWLASVANCRRRSLSLCLRSSPTYCSCLAELERGREGELAGKRAGPPHALAPPLFALLFSGPGGGKKRTRTRTSLDLTLLLLLLPHPRRRCGKKRRKERERRVGEMGVALEVGHLWMLSLPICFFTT